MSDWIYSPNAWLATDLWAMGLFAAAIALSIAAFILISR